MEEKKKVYFESFSKRVGKNNVKKMEEMVKDEEQNIRASYADQNLWISSKDYVELILYDSIFIMEFIIKFNECRENSGDLIINRNIYTSIVIEDLILLENQLPYFIFDKLFGHCSMAFCLFEEKPDQLILELLSLHMKIKSNTKFKHFTDMFRCAYEESLGQSLKRNDLSGPAIDEMKNADYLSRFGVEFKVSHLLNSSKQEGIHRFFFRNQQPVDLLPVSIRKEVDDYSLYMAFNKGCLVMSSFRVAQDSDTILRNVIAYEQCHSHVIPFTSNYIHFINLLVTNEKDVEVLTTEGILRHHMGSPSLVVEMVNKLNHGLRESDYTQYHNIAMNIRAHYKSRRKRCWATLNKVYFNDLWNGTATVAAVLLLFFTLVGTVASVIQAYTSF